MSQTNSDALDVIAQVVVDTIDKKLDDANFDKSQVGTVVAVNGSDYTIAVFGSQYTITSDQVFTVGQSVVVTALQGDMKRLVCSPDNIGTMKTVDSKVNVIGDKVDNFIGNDFADTIIKFNDVKDQIDGSYIIWFESAEPTMSNSPAKDWTTADAKKVHVGDLYYNKVDGTAYKWAESGGSYSWNEITNKDILKVLNAASRDNDTVDGKRRVFYGTPTTPYDQGDVWARVTSDGFMLICQTGRMIEDSYQRTDWVVASKYTDDFVADRAEEKADKANTDLSNFKTEYDSDLKVTKEAIEARVTETKYQQGINGISTRLSTAESSIKQNATNITSKVSATDYTGKKIASMINQQADNVSISASKINLKGAVTTDSISTKGLDASVIKAGKITTEHLDLTGDLTIGEDGHVKIGDNVIDANMLKPDTISEKLWQLRDHVDTSNRGWQTNYVFPEQTIKLQDVTMDMYKFLVIMYRGSTYLDESSSAYWSYPDYGTYIMPCVEMCTSIKEMCPNTRTGNEFILGYRSIDTLATSKNGDYSSANPSDYYLQIFFGNGGYVKSSGVTMDNKYMVPITIYGIR